MGYIKDPLQLIQDAGYWGTWAVEITSIFAIIILASYLLGWFDITNTTFLGLIK